MSTTSPPLPKSSPIEGKRIKIHRLSPSQHTIPSKRNRNHRRSSVFGETHPLLRSDVFSIDHLHPRTQTGEYRILKSRRPMSKTKPPWLLKKDKDMPPIETSSNKGLLPRPQTFSIVFNVRFRAILLPCSFFMDLYEQDFLGHIMRSVMQVMFDYGKDRTRDLLKFPST
ncbi:unnamed protein product [Cochlearia groenlandica]